MLTGAKMPKFLIIFCSILLSITFAFAEEGGGEGSGEEKKAAPKVKNELQDTRVEVDKRANKVKAIREEIKKMMEEKNALSKSDIQKHKELMTFIEEKYREYRTEYEELQKAKTRLRFRFPDKGEKKAEEEEKKENAEAPPPKIDSLEFLEQESGLDLELSKSIELMRSQYKSAGVPKKKAKPKKKNNHEEPEGSDIITIQK